MTDCIICGKPTQMGQGTFKNKPRKYCSTTCIKRSCYLKNKEKYNLANRTWAQNNPEGRAKISSGYMKRNRAYYTSYATLRNRKTKQAQPVWANVQDILDVYKEAKYFQLEVDHIIPIKHPLVCGLHVWNNLQLLSRSENAKKSNKFDIDILALVLETENE